LVTNGLYVQINSGQLCESIAKEIPEMEFPCDFSRDYLPTESGFNTCIKSRKQWEGEGFPELSETSLVCFTDGSRIHSSTGAAYIAGNNSTGVIPLGTHATVFQAEVMAILELADFLISTCDREIHVFVDSLSVLHSLTTGWKTSSLVQECFQALQDVVSQNSLTLHWIPAHKGYDGNEVVDSLAKNAAAQKFWTAASHRRFVRFNSKRN
jgi:ribonuclease HI